MSRKSDIRNEMRKLRSALSAAERALASKTVCDELSRLGPLADALKSRADGVLAVYLASPAEIDLTPFIHEALGRGIALVSPRWNGVAYEPAVLKSLSPEHLRTGPMRILEPAAGDIVRPCDVAAWIIPALAFTEDGARLGYGGGWYDRMLSVADADSLKIGVAHAFQIVEELPAEPHDIRMDLLVTDSRDLALPD